MVHAMEKFKEEGIPYLYLGISPTVVDAQNKPCESVIVKMIVRLLYNYGNMFYSFKGLHFTKSRFQGKEVKTFCAHKYRMPAISFLGLFRMCHLI
jgi:phosphatidylglycerol lysyltransferase